MTTKRKSATKASRKSDEPKPEVEVRMVDGSSWLLDLETANAAILRFQQVGGTSIVVTAWDSERAVYGDVLIFGRSVAWVAPLKGSDVNLQVTPRRAASDEPADQRIHRALVDGLAMQRAGSGDLRPAARRQRKPL